VTTDGPPGRLTRFVTVVLAGTVAAVLLLAPASAAPSVTLLFFGTETCPYCQMMDAFLTDLEAEHAGQLEVQHFEVAQDPAAQQRFLEELAARELQPSGVPVVMLDDQVWIGFNERIAAEVETAVLAELDAVAAPVDDPAEDHAAGPDPPVVGPADGAVPADGVIDVPLVGEVELGGRSAIGTTALIALVDGFNPCSLWVLTVLLAMVLNAGASRGRVAAVGGTFLVVTGLLYGAFIAGVFTIMGFVEHVGGIRIAVAAIALFIGAVNVKDFVAYKRGLSFTIPDRFKPRIYRSGRAIRDLNRPLPVVLGITVAMAAGIALIELPCTAGFPVIWTGIMRTQGVEGLEFAGLLGLYLLIYVLDELLLFAVVVATLQVSRFQETHGRLLKLIGGAVMIALGTVLLVAPELMESLGGATLVVLGAAVLALVIAGLQRLRGGGEDDGRTPPPPARSETPAGSRR
jgi:cytochrome c biogenesis protein CcdA/glutaredoxin